MIRLLLIVIGLQLLQAHQYDLVILAGQSNAQGWTGDARHYPEKSNHLDAEIPLYYEFPRLDSSRGEWIPLGPQRGRFRAGHFGPEVTFARTLTEHGYRPAIFKFTQAGSSLELSWKKPGEGGLYDQMTKELESAIRKLRADGHQVRIRALIWVQGEADAIVPGSAARYEENLDTLVKHFRHRVTRQNSLPVILGVDEKNPYVVRRPIIVEAQKNLCAGDKNMMRTSMLGLKKKDRTHLKPSALVEHGERLATAFFALVRKH